MSARLTAARRLHTAAATAVVLTVAGAAFLPAAAGAAEQQPAGKPLTMTLGKPAPDAPLSRGGATASMTLTVSNSSDQPQDFSAWLLGEADGPAPIQSDSVVLDVSALNAPATKTFVGGQDGGWQGMFYPSSGKLGDGFSVPAKGELTWKVTVGLDRNYPTNDGDLTLTASPVTGFEKIDADKSRNTAVFRTDPQIRPGELNTTWNWDRKVARPGQWAGLTLNTAATGPGEFPRELRRTIVVRPLYVTTHHDFLLEAELGGKRVRLEKTDLDTWELPPLPKGFGSSSGTASVKLYLGLGDHSDIVEDSVVHVRAIYSMGGTYDFAESATEVEAGPAQTTPTTPPPGTASPSPSASPTPTSTPTGTPSATASATATAGAGTSGTTGTGTGTGTSATVTGSMASTGSGSTGPLAAAAAALVALGAAAAFLGARRRRTTRG
ncbi:hypothetical protein C3489_02595 [Streptomyces sp. Ru71]|uniref:hypothetical protein n=1 Tax=Streptomyces sp. Ru71 TaxID=2080746 RepID=UPI000CDDB337|nr:hypothetical protein [Streptomyces sp. Ru71]POX56703.1 hypothetical protein C3489_02595 [Streptomyces sp. Ru71]